jgi:hypothetical protein
LDFCEEHIDSYDGCFGTGSPLFLSAHYYKHNTPLDKQFQIRCFVGKFNEGSIGVIGVVDENIFHSPYWAPYGGFRVDRELSYKKLGVFLEKLVEYLRISEFVGIRVVLAPEVFQLSQHANSFLNLKKAGFGLIHTELSHYFSLERFTSDASYLNRLDRQTLMRTLDRGLTHKIVDEEAQQKAIYEMLQTSRRQRNIPLKMSWERLLAATKFVNVDFWAVYAPDHELCAAAVVYEVDQSTSQVVYWGFDPDYARLDSMRYLSYHMFAYYKGLEKRYLDFGISTDQSIPNDGLIAFKENVGCDACLRFEFYKQLA